ncbi:indoleamine 2,3-dioxygenase [Alkalimarinus coralli]|uniref:indoleamine 2,3-dioxygenase n=1 Tax=Alkalimarinus coralli TaxID=2935863 RepID=UPI00202B0CCB|nr:indoleamine 2,3-dioxygenase [Alkalimarinus coralli]
MQDSFENRGFLPASDPLTHFSPESEFSVLDDIGRDLPSRLLESDFRRYAQSLTIPQWPDNLSPIEHLPELRLYFVRTSFLASAYINQVGQPAIFSLPANIAVPLTKVAEVLAIPPILNYAGYALYNWKRFDQTRDIVLGNIDTIQNFVHLYDEHWFILVHVEIESQAAALLAAVERFVQEIRVSGKLPVEVINTQLKKIADCLVEQLRVLKRIPERMSPELYFKTFRPYIRFFENVEYEGVGRQAMSYRGETGAQSSIMPVLVQLLKIDHKPSALVDHLREIRQYMPQSHRDFITSTSLLPDLKPLAAPELFDQVLELMAQFREVHFEWASEYINKHVKDPRGTGGTPYMHWLRQLIDETRDHKNFKKR